MTRILSSSGWASVVEELTEPVVNTGGRSRFPLSLNTLLQQFQIETRNIMTTVVTYLVYVLLCVAVAIWVGRTLRRYGIIYLTEGHEEKRGLQEALSHLLMVGFYLVSFGVICFVLKHDRDVINAKASIELLSTKVGTVLVFLGVFHLVVLVGLAGSRKQATAEANLKHWRKITHETPEADGSNLPVLLSTDPS